MADNVLKILNETVEYVSKYLGVEVCAKNDIPETTPATEAEAARTLIKLYDVLKANIQNMELGLKGLRETASFGVQPTVAKEIWQHENMLCGKIECLINELRKQSKI
jgi:hypothetical protein